MGINNVSVGQLNLEVCIRQWLKDYPLELHNVILRQKNPSLKFMIDCHHSELSTLVRKITPSSVRATECS